MERELKERRALQDYAAIVVAVVTCKAAVAADLALVLVCESKYQGKLLYFLCAKFDACPVRVRCQNHKRRDIGT